MKRKRGGQKQLAAAAAAVPVAGAATVTQLGHGLDPTMRAAMEATDGVLRSLRETGFAELVVEGGRAKALR